jgi:membrane protease YdiL (CAAX protease family)
MLGYDGNSIESKSFDMTDPTTADEPSILAEPLNLGERDRFFAKAMAFELSLAAAAVVIGWLVGFSPLASMPGAPSLGIAVTWGIVGTIPMVVGLLFFDRFPIGPLKSLKQLTERLVVPLFSGLSIWQLALLSAAAGFGEELLFRGLIQAGMTHGLSFAYDQWIACLVASILFGLCHWLSATYGILAIVIGVYLGVLFVFTDSLLPPMIAHGLYDFVALVYLVKVAKPDVSP